MDAIHWNDASSHCIRSPYSLGVVSGSAVVYTRAGQHVFSCSVRMAVAAEKVSIFPFSYFRTSGARPTSVQSQMATITTDAAILYSMHPFITSNSCNCCEIGQSFFSSNYCPSPCRGAVYLWTDFFPFGDYNRNIPSSSRVIAIFPFHNVLILRPISYNKRRRNMIWMLKQSGKSWTTPPPPVKVNK